MVKVDEKYIADLKVLRAMVVKSKGWLCNFMDTCEQETLVAQTIEAAVACLDKHGEPFGILPATGLESCPTQGVDNGEAYVWLVSQGYFEKASRVINGQSRVVSFPTRKLLDKLQKYFARK